MDQSSSTDTSLLAAATTDAPPAAPVQAPTAPATRVVPLMLAGAFIANLTTQFAATNLADIQGSLGASADEASWITTLYTAASFAGIVASPVMLRIFGMRRCCVGSAALFALFAWLCTMATTAPTLALLRGLQAVVGGGFGPMAFVAIFSTWKGPRIPWGLALLAATLLVSANAGPVLGAYIEAASGWRGLFFAQFWIAGFLAWAGLAWVPASPFHRGAAKTDWTAVALLSLSLGALMVFFTQGTRLFWLESDIIAWSLSVWVGATLAFLVVHFRSPIRILDFPTIFNRGFGLPLLLNLIFRASFATTVYLIPLLLAMTQGWRPLQTANALLWTLLPQIAAFPLAWKLLQRFDGRAVAVVGLLSVGVGTALASTATNLTSGEQLHASLVLIGVGQILFLMPCLIHGALTLKPEQGPTATVAFNGTTLGGTAIGTAWVSHFVTERQKFHSNVLVEQVSWLDTAPGDHLASLGGALTTRLGESDGVALRAIAQVAASVRREAWLLAVDDAFLLMGGVLLLSLIGVLLLRPGKPLSPSAPSNGDAP